VSKRPAVLLALPLILSAAPPPDDAVRAGNAAFRAGDPEAAVRAYASAEERTDDPGLVAFNEATALYQLGQYRDAEQHYRRALEDASTAGLRRPYGLYNLGNCLLQQASDRDRLRLRAATACYEQCLDLLPADDALVPDANHNLELARLLLSRARSAAPDKSDPDDDRDSMSRPEDPPPSPVGDGQSEPRPTEPRPGGNEKAPGTEKGPAPVPSNDAPPPGAGNLPVLLDNDRPQHLAPEEVTAFLNKATERSRRDRLNKLQPLGGKGNDRDRDW
jgi:tetratricopeptide (TPR) repeat protein